MQSGSINNDAVMAPPDEGTRQGKPPINAGVTIGHVHLKVADLERSIDFYQGDVAP